MSAAEMQLFWERIQGHSSGDAIAYNGEVWSYTRLNEAIQTKADELRAGGIGTGCVLVITGEFCLHQVAVLFAAVRCGCVTVPLPEISPAEVAACERIVDGTHRGTIGHDGALDVQDLGTSVTNELMKSFLVRKEPGLVVLTSGSTGDKKGILHSWPKLLAKFLKPREAYRTLSFLKLDHMGGINTILHTLANGGTVVFPRTRTVAEVVQLIRTYAIELLPTTPSFLNLLLLMEGDQSDNLASVKLITYGTELMPEQTLLRLRQKFPNIRLQQTYGLSEVGVLRSKSEGSDSLWVKVGGEGYETRVINGTLWIRAHSAMEGYLNCSTPIQDDGWLDTGDLVEVRGDYVRFLGRKSEIINVAGQKVFPAEVENFLLGLPNIKDAVVAGERNPVLGNIVTARISLANAEPEQQARTRIKQACAQALRRYMVPVKIEFSDDLPYSDRFKKLRRPAQLA